jgi:nucleoid-associated protein YejK
MPPSSVVDRRHLYQVIDAQDRAWKIERLHFYRNGKRTKFYTYVSHGKSGEDVGDDIVKSMKRQLGLATAKQVRELVECTMDGAQYLSALLASGALATEVPKGPTPAPSKKGNR